jgi:hypothetical protein
MPVTIDDFGVCPGRALGLIFPRTEEARGSNPLTSTADQLSQLGFSAVLLGFGAYWVTVRCRTASSCCPVRGGHHLQRRDVHFGWALTGGTRRLTRDLYAGSQPSLNIPTPVAGMPSSAEIVPAVRNIRGSLT